MRTFFLTFAAALALTACGAGDHYDECGGGDDCNDGLACYTIAYEEGADGAMCSGNCAVDADCPGNGACYELVGDPMVGQRICYERCSSDYDCAVRFACIPIEDEAGLPLGGLCLPCPSDGCPPP